MPNYVVDTSIVIQRFIRETYTPNVRALLNRLLVGDQLYIPEFCLLECSNVFWKQVRFYGLSEEKANQFINELREISFQIVPVSYLLNSALKIGLTYQLAIYDSLYIALALRLDYPLITVDERQAQAAKDCGVTLIPITDFKPQED
ncbi:type II toxin-antitoxin system VapC family toxin [Gloeothece verrucosa]|uniref:PilT protein domain protein n=1 Tax=Gloeothece verrucosa (strain PCC 7822) TaxID=497965 RepID=E0UBW0_GLOV7|nr:type II toxin-antitoxin system VapC family toxin [Gloeothece verrucosa]ADN15175.1 PilT protein domain protein [Gloeothece verrucosa PCC 7822]